MLKKAEPKYRGVKAGLFWTGLEKVFVQGVAFVQGVILARLLCPEDFGLTAMLGVFLCIGGTLADCGLGSALVVKEFAGCGLRMERKVLWWNLGVGGVIYLALAIASPWIADFYRQPMLREITWVMGAGIVLHAASSVAMARLTREMRFGAQAVANVAGTFVAAIVAVAMAFGGAGVWAVAALGVCAAGVRTAVAWTLAKGCEVVGAETAEVKFRSLLGYGWKLVLSGLVHSVYVNVYELVLGKAASAAAVGLYNRSNGWLTATRNFVNPTVERVSFPVLAKGEGSGWKFVVINVVMLWPMLAVLWIWTPEIIGVVFGEQWLECAKYMRILIVGQFFTPFGNVALNALRARGRPDLVLKTDAVKKPLGLVALVCGIPFGIVGICWAKVVNDFFEAAVDAWYAWRPKTKDVRKNDIDLVYLWYGAKEPPKGIDKCRACDNGELYWSLRSVDKFAPWFRKIFVLVNDGTAIPEWLAANHRVEVVELSRFVEPDVLPLNNSAAIEMWMHRVSGLSERFVYANDDMFLGRSVEPSDFFDSKGRVICRYDKRSLVRGRGKGTGNTTYNDMLQFSRQFLGVDFYYGPHHNMDAYLKSVISEFWTKYPEECRRSGSFTRRVSDQLHRDVFSLYAMNTGRGVWKWAYGMVRLKRALGLAAYDSMYIPIEDRDGLAWLLANRPKMFCLNDTENSSDSDRRNIVSALKKMIDG